MELKAEYTTMKLRSEILVSLISVAQLTCSRQGWTALQVSLAIHFHRRRTSLFLIKKKDFFCATAIFICLHSYDDTLQSCHYIGDISINHTLLDTVIE